MINSKNQMIRSMKSYEVGGSSDDPCIEIVMIDGKPKKRKKQKCGPGKTKRVYSPKEIAKGVAGAAIGTAALIGGLKLDKKYGLVDKGKEKVKELFGLKKGGPVRKTIKKKK